MSDEKYDGGGSIRIENKSKYTIYVKVDFVKSAISQQLIKALTHNKESNEHSTKDTKSWGFGVNVNAEVPEKGGGGLGFNYNESESHEKASKHTTDNKANNEYSASYIHSEFINCGFSKMTPSELINPAKQGQIAYITVIVEGKSGFDSIRNSYPTRSDRFEFGVDEIFREISAASGMKYFIVNCQSGKALDSRYEKSDKWKTYSLDICDNQQFLLLPTVNGGYRIQSVVGDHYLFGRDSIFEFETIPYHLNMRESTDYNKDNPTWFNQCKNAKLKIQDIDVINRMEWWQKPFATVCNSGYVVGYNAIIKRKSDKKCFTMDGNVDGSNLVLLPQKPSQSQMFQIIPCLN